MKIYNLKTAWLYIIILPVLFFCSCYKKQIQFGNDLAESYTRLVRIDTITPVLSTFVLDSFPTSGNNVLFAGRFNDPVTGTLTAQTYFQFGLPAAAGNDLPADATFDSLVLELKPNGYYYGDTSKRLNFTINELNNQPDYTYAGHAYNTSSLNVKPAALGSLSAVIRPNSGNKITIKLSNGKGADLFTKIKSKSIELTSESGFLEYFKGINIQPAATDTGAVFGFATDSSLSMKLYYHLSNPYPEQKVIEFFVTRTDYQFNQLVTSRTGTFLQPSVPNQKEFPATTAYPYAITQSGNGLLLKIKFPSLREILKTDDVVELLDAQLVLKPVENTFGPNGLLLPPSLYLAQTDATNSIGYSLPDSTGEGILTAYPSIDHIYQLNTEYRFPLTVYINALANIPNSADYGVFVLEEDPGSAQRLNRAVIGNPQYKTQLVLTVLMIN